MQILEAEILEIIYIKHYISTKQTTLLIVLLNMPVLILIHLVDQFLLQFPNKTLKILALPKQDLLIFQFSISLKLSEILLNTI